MASINLLIIEDDKDQIQSYIDTIEQYNKNNEHKYTYKICKTFAEGEEALKTPFFDAAIIDLKLSNSEELEGKKLVLSVYRKIRIPIIIYSGSLAQIDDIKENALLKKKLRTEQLSDILNDILLIYNTGITSFLKPSGDIDNTLTQIFWDHLSNDIETWINHNNSKTLLRYIISHFQEHLEIDIEGGFEEYHPFEVYIKPSIKKNIHTGDIITYKNELYLILTPACDIVILNYTHTTEGNKIPNRKAQNIVLVKLKEFDIKQWCTDKSGAIDKGKIKEFVNNQAYRFHYLPPINDNNGFLVDFQDIVSVPVADSSNFIREASISSPFIKDIISRFSSYYSRQGQPTFYQKTIVDELYKKTTFAKAK